VVGEVLILEMVDIASLCQRSDIPDNFSSDYKDRF
jgi:hypothetical protein